MKSEKWGALLGVIITIPVLLSIDYALEDHMSGNAFVMVAISVFTLQNFILACFYSSEKKLSRILTLFLYYFFLNLFFGIVIGLILIIIGIGTGSMLGKIGG
jgi:hypothetical protein